MQWPEDLVSAIARRRSVVFLGAGVSMTSVSATGEKPPSWKAFLEDGINRCTGNRSEMKRLLKNGDYLSCCQIIKYKLGPDWVSYVEKRFLNPQFQPNDLHRAVFSLDSSIVLTPNFDKIFDTFASTQSQNLLKVKKFYEDDIPRVLRGGGNQRLILKIHGCIDTPDKLVFTREDYANVRNLNANFYRAMDALIFTHTFLFLGCSLRDPDLSLVLEQYARAFAATPPHYVALGEKVSQEYNMMLGKNYNLRILPYSTANDHKELLDSVKDLATLVELERERLAASTLW